MSADRIECPECGQVFPAGFVKEYSLHRMMHVRNRRVAESRTEFRRKAQMTYAQSPEVNQNPALDARCSHG